MRWMLKKPRTWVLTRNGRTAFALEIRSTVDRDDVHFRFTDEHRVRRVSTRRFLELFSRVPEHKETA